MESIQSMMKNRNIVINGDNRKIRVFEHKALVFNANGSITIEDNITSEFEGFYVSYNPLDIRSYGCTTTALVLGQMQRFYILKGNHTAQYEKLISEGFEACLNYYNTNSEHQHEEVSDNIPTIITEAANNGQ